MGSTETTFYTIAIYTSSKIKIRYVLVAALCGDLIGMIVASIVCQIM